MNEYEKKYCGKYTLAIRVPQSEANQYENKDEGARAIISNTMAQLADWLDHYGFEMLAEDTRGFSNELQCMDELELPRNEVVDLPRSMEEYFKEDEREKE